MGHDRSRINGRDDDREPRTVQMIVGPSALCYLCRGRIRQWRRRWLMGVFTRSMPTRWAQSHHRASEADIAVFLDRLPAHGVVGKRYWRATLMSALRAGHSGSQQGGSRVVQCPGVRAGDAREPGGRGHPVSLCPLRRRRRHVDRLRQEEECSLWRCIIMWTRCARDSNAPIMRVAASWNMLLAT